MGLRLALQALNKIYQQNIPCEAPRLRANSLNKRKRELMLKFDNYYQGLNLNDDCEYVDGLTLIQNDIIYDHIPVKKIERNVVVLNLQGFDLDKPITINIAEVDYCSMNLINSAGIPARPSKMEAENEIS